MALLDQLWSDYRDFFDRNSKRLPKALRTRPGQCLRKSDGSRRTQESFGFEWTQFSRMRPEWLHNFLGYLGPRPESCLSRGVVLDAGCGMGRHLYFASDYGAEVIGVDFSRAVDAAYENTRDCPRSHVVQADLTRLCFRSVCFDFIYCLGVLHHLPNPHRGLESLISHLKPGAELRMYVYWTSEDESAAKRCLLSVARWLRRGTTRVPPQVLLPLCYPISMALWLALVLPSAVLGRSEMTRSIANRIPLRQYADYPFGVLLNDQLDRLSAPIERRYSHAQVKQWLRDVGLGEVTVQPHFGWVGHGKKPDHQLVEAGA
ncbi:MAG TPA: class I SAM-dependent methyltransferase [Pirellulaceae bacterium]|nr:class I SAM-dependent methyltransferase [Pirellulaceae bacterium]